MILLIGVTIVFVALFAALAFLGVGPAALLQEAELVVVIGFAVGGLIIGNPSSVLRRILPAIISSIRGPRYHKQDYVELLSLIYQTFKLAKAKGMLALEGHVEHPKDSNLFTSFPVISGNEEALTFLCDYLRLLTLGTDNPHEVESLIDEEIEILKEERGHVANSVQVMADAFPALGICAAVLGVIKTMSLIDQPVEIIGGAIAAALVGTFLGVFFGYALFGPLASSMHKIAEAEISFFSCMRAGLLAYMQGYAPAVCIEFARKAISNHVRPNFYEVEEATQSLPPV